MKASDRRIRPFTQHPDKQIHGWWIQALVLQTAEKTVTGNL
jgi:hypothetical protein